MDLVTAINLAALALVAVNVGLAVSGVRRHYADRANSSRRRSSATTPQTGGPNRA
ncbi:hypothetical protein [Saccharomonospora sp. CUA-673]|uniref:hypothetical protein n=1 Tax=Saccharomonospora sp. CUA-673 TaxID=1904969 RepID=UPI001C9E54FF|nr:hypothetical protein [Saccharomonospora sp. CUA-673]